MLRDPHHIPAHDNRQFFVGTFFINIKLDICKIYHMELNRPRINGNKFCQIHNLFFCPLTCIRRGMEIYRFNLHASLRDHISCHRAVDSAGEKKHCASVCSHRHAPRTGNNLGIQIDFLADFHIQTYIRIVNVYFHIRKRVQHGLTQSAVDLHGIHGIPFVGASCFHFKSTVSFRVHLTHIGNHVLFQLFYFLYFFSYNRADAHNTEDAGNMLHSLLIVIFSAAVHVHSPVAFMDTEISLHV